MGSRILQWTILVVGLALSGGSIYASVGMGLKPCPLCYFERTLAFVATAFVALGMIRGLRAGAIELLFPLGGAVVAGFHVYLELSGKLECPLGLFGLGSLPKQSLAGFSLMTILLLIDVLMPVRDEKQQILKDGMPLQLLTSLLLACAIGFAFIYSAPPLPAPPKEDYNPKTQPFKGCRPPYNK